MTTREQEIGRLALAQHAAKIKVLEWMTAETKRGKSPSAAQSPNWNEYQQAVQAFETTLSAVSPQELSAILDTPSVPRGETTDRDETQDPDEQA